MKRNFFAFSSDGGACFVIIVEKIKFVQLQREKVKGRRSTASVEKIRSTAVMTFQMTFIATTINGEKHSVFNFRSCLTYIQTSGLYFTF